MQNFIKENNISFKEGERNSSVTILVGYAQFKGVSKDKLKEELASQIIEDDFISEEIDRLWNYCKGAHYKDFWELHIAKTQYKF